MRPLATAIGAGMRTGLHTVARVVLDALLPPQCLACDATVEAPGRLCGACFRAITFLGEPCCDRCGQGFVHFGQGRVVDARLCCDACVVRPPAWDRARGALLYDAASSPLVLRLKYADRVEHAGPLAAMMVRAGARLLGDADAVMPVPLHRRRLLARRYNQAGLLAREVARQSGLALLPDALRRVRPTASLGHLGPEARAASVRGAFVLRASRSAAVRDRRVVLVDDVLTSGATAGACAQVLLQSGAARVDVLVAARAGRLEA